MAEKPKRYSPKGGYKQKGFNPASLGNLKPRKKGEPALNPLGAPPKVLRVPMRNLVANDLVQVYNLILHNDVETVRELSKEEGRFSLLQITLMRTFLRTIEMGEINMLDAFLTRLADRYEAAKAKLAGSVQGELLSFREFCERCDYPPPFEKQMDMMNFVVSKDVPRLLLGARNYGKTDYAIIMGVAYQIYLEYRTGVRETSVLIVTKSDERNKAMLAEIQRAAEKMGETFEISNASAIRTKGFPGKENTVSAVTIGTASLRGRHPTLVILDDPVTPEDTSEATRRKAQKVYEELLKLTSNLCIIGQPVHKFDLYAKLRGLLKKMEVPHGSIPELDADLNAQKLAGVSDASIQASYNLKIISDGTLPFERLQEIDVFAPGDSVAFIDPSFEGGDYTALTIMRGYFEGVQVVGFVWKQSWDACAEAMAKKCEKYGVRRLCFETNNLGTQPLDMLRQVFPDSIGIHGKKSLGNKHARIVNAGAYAHLVHLSKESDQTYVDQVKQYEHGAEYDDAPDSLASCLEWVGLIRGQKRS